MLNLYIFCQFQTRNCYPRRSNIILFLYSYSQNTTEFYAYSLLFTDTPIISLLNTNMYKALNFTLVFYEKKALLLLDVMLLIMLLLLLRSLLMLWNQEFYQVLYIVECIKIKAVAHFRYLFINTNDDYYIFRLMKLSIY